MRIANTIQTALLCELFFVIPLACNVATNEKDSVNSDGENDTADIRDKETNEDKEASTDSDSESISDSEFDTEIYDTGSDTKDEQPPKTPLCTEKVSKAEIVHAKATDDYLYTSGYVPTFARDTSVTIGDGNRAQDFSFNASNAAQSFVTKTNAEGETLWNIFFRYETAASGRFAIQAIYPNSRGLFVLGQIPEGTALLIEHSEVGQIGRIEYEKKRLVIFKFSDEGEMEWTRKIDDNDCVSILADDEDIVLKCKVDTDVQFETGNTPISIEIDTPINVLLRYNKDGNVVFIRRIENLFNLSHYILEDGSILLYGTYTTPITFQSDDSSIMLKPFEENKTSTFLARYDETGKLIFARPILGYSKVQRVVDMTSILESLTKQIKQFGDQIFIPILHSETITVEGEDELLEFSPTMGMPNSHILLRYTLDGQFLGATQLLSSFVVCETKALNRQETAFDVVFVCIDKYGNLGNTDVIVGSGDVAQTFFFERAKTEVFAARFNYDGALLNTKRMMYVEFSYYYIETFIRTFFLNGNLTIFFSSEIPIFFSDEENQTPDLRNNVFDTRIAVYDDSFTRIAVHRARTIKDLLISTDDTIVLSAKNTKGFTRFNDHISLDDTAYVVHFRTDGTFQWIEAAGKLPKQIVETENDIIVITEDLNESYYVKNVIDGIRIDMIPNTKAVYAARMDKVKGNLKSYGLLVKSDNGKCDLFDREKCTADTLSIEDANSFRNTEQSNMLREQAWQQIAKSIKPSCLAACDASEKCAVKADCNAEGVEANISISENTYHEIGTGSSKLNYSYQRSAHVLRENTDGLWSEAEYTDDSSDSYGYHFVSMSHQKAKITWSGMLTENLPKDSSLSFSVEYYNMAESGYYHSYTYDFSTGMCSIEYRTSSEERISYKTQSQQIDINGRVCELVSSQEDDDKWYFVIDDVCIAEVDYKTWEELGSCEE